MIAINHGPWYRLLEQHEIVSENDEYRRTEDGAPWLSAEADGDYRAGASPGCVFRRKIRESDPGWRWLDVGETVRPEDSGDARAIAANRVGEPSRMNWGLHRRIEATRPSSLPTSADGGALCLGPSGEIVPNISPSIAASKPKAEPASRAAVFFVRPETSFSHHNSILPVSVSLVRPTTTDGDEFSITFDPGPELGPDPDTEPDRRVACECGNHSVKTHGDIYAQHNAYVNKACRGERHTVTRGTRKARGIGISAERPTLTVLGPDALGDDVAADAPGALEMMRGSR